MSNRGWIGVDLDGTLAHYEKWRGMDHIGAPVPAMVTRVKQWLNDGEDVRIFTARVGPGQDPAEVDKFLLAITHWTMTHLGRQLPVTCVKDFGMVALYDDRAYTVEKNTGYTATDPRQAYRVSPCSKCGEDGAPVIRCGGDECEPERPPYFVHCAECYSRETPPMSTKGEAVAWWNGYQAAEKKHKDALSATGEINNKIQGV